MLKNSYLFLLLFYGNSLIGNTLGSLLFHGNCITCHDKTKTISAPSMIEVQRHYKSAFPKKTDFIKYMSQWVAKPDKKTSIMLQAIDKHGVMPHLGFEVDALKEIVEYIYDTDFSTQSTHGLKR